MKALHFKHKQVKAETAAMDQAKALQHKPEPSPGNQEGMPRFLERFQNLAAGLAPLQRWSGRRDWGTDEDGKGSLEHLAGLSISRPDDVWEQEAERVSNQVTRGDAETMRGRVGRRSDLDVAGSPISYPSSGCGIPSSVRRRIEPKVGVGLAPVRVHEDADAREMARFVGARAFTLGHHIWLGPGQRADDIPLMAHEATHVVQQANSGPMIQRTPEEGNRGSEAGERSSAPSSAGARRRAAEASTLLADLPERTDQEQGDLNTILEAYELYRLIEQKEAMERRFSRESGRGMGMVRYTSYNAQLMQRIQEQIDSECERLGLANEDVAKHLIRQRMPRMVLRRAKQAAIALLDRNEAMARAEMARYAELICSPDIDGLLQADRELEQRYAAMQSTTYDVERASTYISAVPAGVPETAEDYHIPPNEASIMYVITRIDEYRARLVNQRSEYEAMRSRFGQMYPVLLTEGYVPGRFSSAPPEQLGQVTAQPLQEVIDNIHEVKDAVRDDEMKVWNMHQVLEIAIADMRIGGIYEYMEIVRNHIRREQADRGFLEMVKAALAITTTIIAGLVGGPLGASLVGGAWGSYFLSESVGRYMMESAAENVSMDPEVRDISVNEPELLWVVLDIVGLGLDVGVLVRTLRPLARAALQTRRIAAFSQTVRRIAPDAAGRLIASLRRRLGREVLEEGAAGSAAARALGEGRNLDEYLDALRSEQHSAGTVGRSWDYPNQPRGLPDSQWRPGDPIDMPNTRGTYPAYDTARGRYWRNRAHFELEARQRGQAVHRPGVTTDPVSGLTDGELRRMRDSGRAPEYAYPNRPGQTWELEHHGVPQRVGGWLRDLGFDQPGEASRLIEASRPGSLMEVTPLEHAFFDVEAHGFGRLRADVTGARWGSTAAGDIRSARPLYYMSDETLREITSRAASSNMDFSRTVRTRQLRDALRDEIAERGLSIPPP